MKRYYLILVAITLLLTSCQQTPKRIPDPNYSESVEYSIRKEVNKRFGKFPSDALKGVDKLYFLELNDSKGLEKIPLLDTLVIENIGPDITFNFLDNYSLPLNSLTINGGQLSKDNLEYILKNTPHELYLRNVVLEGDFTYALSKKIRILELNNVSTLNNSLIHLHNINVKDTINVRSTDLSKVQLEFSKQNAAKNLIIKENVSLYDSSFLYNFESIESLTLDVTNLPLMDIQEYIINSPVNRVELVVDDKNYNLDIFSKFRDQLSMALPEGNRKIIFDYYE